MLALAALTCLLLQAGSVQGATAQGATVLPGGVRDASALYPCARPATLVRCFHLEEDAPEMAKVAPALRELGAEVVHGPRTTPGWPGNSFVAVRSPSGVEAQALAAALKKGGGAAHLLEGVAFEGRRGKEHDFGLGGLGVTQRDVVRGMSSDITWYEARGSWGQFYGRPGKLDPRELIKRYAKLYEPYGGAELGEVVRERFTWTLLAAPSDKVRHEVLRKLEKDRRILGATIEGTKLTVTVQLTGLEASADLGAIPDAGQPLDEASAATPRLAYDVTALYDVLKAEELVP